jgi:hypothetical protein
MANDPRAFANGKGPGVGDLLDSRGIYERPYDDTVRVAQLRHLWTILELYAEQGCTAAPKTLGFRQLISPASDDERSIRTSGEVWSHTFAPVLRLQKCHFDVERVRVSLFSHRRFLTTVGRTCIIAHAAHLAPHRRDGEWGWRQRIPTDGPVPSGVVVFGQV